MRHRQLRHGWESASSSTPASNADSSLGTFSPDIWPSPLGMGGLIRHTIEEEGAEGAEGGPAEPIVHGGRRFTGRRR